MYVSFISQLMQHAETTAIIVSFPLKYVDNQPSESVVELAVYILKSWNNNWNFHNLMNHFLFTLTTVRLTIAFNC
jgi:hypothetical protein